MLIRLEQKPKNFMHPGDTGDVYYILLYGEETLGYLSLNFSYAPYCMVHLQILKTTKQRLRYGVDVIWPEIVSEAKDKGCSFLVADSPGNVANTEKFQKFCGYFGFDNFVEHVTSMQRI